MSYYISKTIDGTFEGAINKVTETLKAEGFGVLTEIRIHEKLKEKLDVDFRQYVILGACHPASAYKVLQHDDKIGTMLPCNVIIQEIGDRQMEVAAIDPVASMQAIRNENVVKMAEEIRDKLQKAISNL